MDNRHNMEPTASIILPTYNEAENLKELVPRLMRLDSRYEIVVVDDGSRDGTSDVVKQLSFQYPVRLLERGEKKGLASAVIDGVIQEARAPIVVVMDADLSHDESIVSQLVAAVTSGSDIAIGSRFASGGSTEDRFHRRIFSWCAKQLARTLLQIRVQDPMSGFFALRRNDFLSLAPALQPRGFKILLEILARMRPRHVTEVGFRFRSRTKGESKLTTRIAAQYFRMVWDLWRHRQS